MRVLFFGDVFGKPGRDAVKIAMQRLVGPESIDFVVVNGENMAHGNGILPEMADEFFSLGVDVITTGNHAWDQPESVELFARTERLPTSRFSAASEIFHTR